MSFHNISMLYVGYDTGVEKHAVGRLALKEKKLFFEYNPAFLQTGLGLSPFLLPLRPGVFVTEDRVFDGLFGVFHDSLPDGWGHLLLDRKLLRAGIHPGKLTPLDRLYYVGTRGMGALVYEPEAEDHAAKGHENLDEVAQEILLFQEKEEDRFVDDLLIMNGASSGARPKIWITLPEDAHAAAHPTSASAQWLVKFRSAFDLKDIGPIEYAYHLMAVAAHLDVPPARLFPSQQGPGYFGVNRFDRVGGKRLHMHTVGGLLHADHRLPSLDYETILKATGALTKDARESEKQWRAAVFNVLTHNRDDHAKNFSFLMDAAGRWRVSPAYDLTFSMGPAGEHCTTVLGEGKNPTKMHLLALAEGAGIDKKRALQVIDEIRAVVTQWKRFSAEAGVTKRSQSLIQSALQHVDNNLYKRSHK